MPNVQVRTSLNITGIAGEANANLNYRSYPTAFNPTITGKVGPTPGSILVSPAGTDVDLSQIVVPGGLYIVYNMDTANYVEVGVWDGATFFPKDEILPGEFYLNRMSRNLGKDEPGTGTGAPVGTTHLRLKAHNASCEVFVGAFDA